MSTAKIVAELGGKEPPPYTWIVINVLYYLKPLSRLIVQSEPLENIGSDMQRSAFISLKSILSILQSGANDPININPFLEKLCFVTNTSLVEFESSDIHSIWDSVVKLITAVIPPLREVFLGRISDSADIPCWTSLLSRCFHAQFQASTPTLEDVMRATLAGYEDEDEEEEEYGDEEDADLYDPRPPLQRIEKFNANILYRAPEILVFMVESSHLPPNLRFSEMCAGVEGNSAPPGTISFPSSFDVSALLNETEEEYPPQMYDLSVVVSLEDKPEDDPASPPAEAPLPGADAMTPPAFDSVRALYRSVEEGEQMGHGGWFEGMGSRAHHQEVAADTVLTNFFSPHRVHPRVLIYTKRDMALQRLGKYVTRAGQMRSLGDVSFESAETPEQYDEARHFYLEAIAYDAALRPALTERLNALEQIERNQRAQCYETQADISLGRRRFKEACDLYKNAMRSAVVNSPLHQRIREKEDYMMKIISLEIANHLTEKGQDCVKAGSFLQGKEHFMQALKLYPTYTHLQIVISGIEQAITVQTSEQRVHEANQAMRGGKFRTANTLFLEAIALVPARESSLAQVLDSLVGLMQGEEALVRQRLGLVALEDKKYDLAIQLITEAIHLLPPESLMEHAFFLCDRALVYLELKEFHTAIEDCNAALALRSDLAMGYLRLGAAQFELELYDEASDSYDKAMRNDASLGDQVKAKVRQVNTAKEILQRKEREAERARLKEEERKQLDERRAREDTAKKQRQAKVDQEKQEKAERVQMQREEALARGEDKGSVESPADKSAVKEKAKRDKAERDLVKGQERVSAKLEKEKERERVKREKEMKVQEEVRARQEEVQKQKDFANELGRVQDLHKESEREREVEREKARVERERTIAERERAREEKMAEAKKTKEKEKEKEKGVKAPPTSAAPAPPVVTSASIFGGAKVTLRGGKSSTDLLATLSEPVVPPLPAPIVPPPTSSWSSLLTPPPPTAPNPTVSAPAPPPPPPPAPAPTPAWSASSSSSSYPNPYLGSAASAAAGAGRMGNAGGMGMGMGNGMGGMSNMGMGMGMGMGNSMGMGNGMGGMGNMGMGMGMGMMNMGMGMPMGMGGMGMDMGMGMSGMGNSMGMGGMSQPVPDSISDFPPLGDSAPEGKAEARRRQSGPTAPPTPSSGSRSGSRSNSVSGPSEPYRYVPSSAWADHQRAQLEAAAEGISTEKAPAPPATGTRSSSSASGTGVGSNGSASPSIESGSSSSSVNGLIEGASAAKVAGADEDRDINLLLSSSLGSLDTPYGQGGIPGMDELGRDLRTANSFGIGFGLGDGGMGNMGSIGGIGGLDLGSLDLGLGLGGSGSGARLGAGLGGGAGFGQIGYPVDSFSSLIGGGVGLGQDMFTRGGSGSGSGSRAVGGVGGGGGGLSGGDDLMGILGGGFSNYMEPDPLRPQESRMGYGGSGSSFSTFDGMGMGMGMGNVGISSNLGLGLGIGGREGSSLLSGFSFPHAPDISISPPGALGGISRPSSASPFSSPPEQFRTPPPPPPPLPLPLPPHPPALALRGRSTQSTPARPLYSLLGQAKPSRGLDVHQLPETDFRSVAWLRAYGMHMYRWGGSGAEEAGQGQEWTEFAMHVPVSAAPALFSEDGAPLPVLGEIRARSGCALWDDWEDLGSVQSRFLVFRRTGVAGAGADRCLLAALDLVGSVVQRFLAAQAHALQGGQAQAPPSSKAPPGPPGLTDSFLDKVVSHSGPTPAPPIVPAPSSASNRDRRDSSDSRDVSVDMSYLPSDAPSTHVRKDRPAPLKSFPLSGPAYVQRNLEIPRDVVGLVIGQGGKKIKELCGESGAKIQFRVNKSAEREGRPGLLEVTGSADNADKALQLIWDVLQLLGREYSEVPISQNSKGK